MTHRVEIDSREVKTKIAPSDSRYFEIVDFALALPSKIGVGAAQHEPGHQDHSLTGSGEHGIVGVITILSPKSVMIWLGWGDLGAFNALASGEASSVGSNSRGSQRVPAIGKCTFLETFVCQAAHVLVTNFKRMLCGRLITKL